MGNCQTASSVETPKSSASKFKGKHHIFIKSYTWSRDSHGLFDYENKNLIKKNLKTDNQGKIVRVGDDVRVARESEKKQNSEETHLMNLMIKDGHVVVDNCRERQVNRERPDDELQNCDKDLWLVVKSLKTNPASKGYKLGQGDLIKFGRIKYRVRELKGSMSKNSKHDKNTRIEDDNISVGESDKKSATSTPGATQVNVAQTCRICLSETPELGDPFFSPCNCTGTMKYIHVKCLQRWLKSKLQFKHVDNLTSIYWKSLECELCKTQFPTYFMVEDKRYDIVDFERPDQPYVMLDVLNKDKNIVRGIHIMRMENKNSIRLGRGHDSDIRMTDISVSRCHAFIRFDKGEYYIDDNSSKFGTLVHLNKGFIVPHDVSDVSLQIGRTVVALTVKRGKKFFSSCLKPNFDQDNSSEDERHSEAGEEEAGGDDEPPSAASPTFLNASPLRTDFDRSPTSPVGRQPIFFSPPQGEAENTRQRLPSNHQVGGAQDENLADEEEEKESNENRVLGIEHLNAGRNHFDEENSRPEIPLSHGNYDAEPTVQDQRNRSQNEVSRRQDAILSNYPSHQELPMNEQLADSGECDGPVD